MLAPEVVKKATAITNIAVQHHNHANAGELIVSREFHREDRIKSPLGPTSPATIGPRRRSAPAASPDTIHTCDKAKPARLLIVDVEIRMTNSGAAPTADQSKRENGRSSPQPARRDFLANSAGVIE